MKYRELTLREAIESKRPYRRKDWDQWHEDPDHDYVSGTDALAKDWEVQLTKEEQDEKDEMDRLCSELHDALSIP